MEHQPVLIKNKLLILQRKNNNLNSSVKRNISKFPMNDHLYAMVETPEPLHQQYNNNQSSNDRNIAEKEDVGVHGIQRSCDHPVVVDNNLINLPKYHNHLMDYSFYNDAEDNLQNISAHNFENIKYECYVCQVDFKTFGQLKEHLLEHPYFYDCFNCGASFNRIQHLTNHICVFNTKQYRCSTCDKEFHFKFALKEHQQLLHNEFMDNTNHRSSMMNQSKQFVCTLCKCEFISNVQLQTHIKRSLQSINQCKRCGIMYRKDKFDLHQKRCKKNVSCENCKRTFRNHRSLLIHKRKCLEKLDDDDDDDDDGNKKDKNGIKKHKIKDDFHVRKKFKCKQCSVSYLNKSTLYTHIKLKHINVSNYRCKLCSKCYASELHLTKHLLWHSGEKPHRCSQCEKSFNNIYALNNHKLLHYDETAFKCHLCDRNYTNVHNLRRHHTLNHI